MMAVHYDEADYKQEHSMASTESGRQMYPSFKEAHEAFVAEYTALYHGFPKYLEDLVIGFGWGEDASGKRWFIISANPQGLQHLTYPELVSWDFEGFTDLPELIRHARLDSIKL